jgi:hypothetical protein
MQRSGHLKQRCSWHETRKPGYPISSFCSCAFRLPSREMVERLASRDMGKHRPNYLDEQQCCLKCLSYFACCRKVGRSGEFEMASGFARGIRKWDWWAFCTFTGIQSAVLRNGQSVDMYASRQKARHHLPYKNRSPSCQFWSDSLAERAEL